MPKTFESSHATPHHSDSPSHDFESAMQVLLVEDSLDFAYLVQSALARSPAVDFHIEWTQSLRNADWLMENERYDAVLLDLLLPDSSPSSTIEWWSRWADVRPVIVLTGTNDQKLAITACDAGALEYLVKDQINCRCLPEKLLGAIAGNRGISQRPSIFEKIE